ncbi:hypothetical protein K9N68_21240 [Kovacikia minuta CCNUW1]|uniref:hypothetical protein n=1 Tax=Kovacikia minuta TaxID=2931930 RepID=UPI001CCDD344|nr:hypothetical protein [Kovacikia minuta]UBF24229.1 hypothetical protein K9N68_21240 [Kovacikia minuta CCNUW1]
MTGNINEEVMAFGISVEHAKTEAEQLLINRYGFTPETTIGLLRQAQIEPLAQWCSPS